MFTSTFIIYQYVVPIGTFEKQSVDNGCQRNDKGYLMFCMIYDLPKGGQVIRIMINDPSKGGQDMRILAPKEPDVGSNETYKNDKSPVRGDINNMISDI
ncbi:MAG: hypothetical protein KAG99_09930 [Bacteroidales bacterium]|nr:hypothetical protein [Bacteroidales bacterium]